MYKPVSLKATHLVDADRYRVYLKPGFKYMVNGVEMTPQGDTWREPNVGYEVSSLSAVLVAQQELDKRGFYSFAETTLSHEDYHSRLRDLRNKAFEEDEDDDDAIVVVLDKEAYKEFQHLRDDWVWNPDTLKTVWVEPNFEVDLARLSSGDPFVYSARTSLSEPYTWEYNQAGATAAYVSACFAGLGMHYIGEGSLQAPGEGCWCNSEHSHLKYVRAFGKYLFAKDGYLYDFMKCPRYYQGPLEDMLARSRSDKEFIERVIISAYKEATGSRPLQKNEITEVLKDLRSVLSELDSVKTARNSGVSLAKAKQKIRDRVTALENILVEEYNEGK